MSAQHPNYSPVAVESAVVHVVTDLHPEHLPESELARQIVSNLDDRREVETFATAIRNLQEYELLKKRGDAVVEPTPGLLRAVVLFVGPTIGRRDAG